MTVQEFKDLMRDYGHGEPQDLMETSPGLLMAWHEPDVMIDRGLDSVCVGSCHPACVWVHLDDMKVHSKEDKNARIKICGHNCWLHIYRKEKGNE